MMQVTRRTAWDYYCSNVGETSRLSPEAELKLARRWREGDQPAGAELVRASLPFVIRIAKEYRRWGVDFEDLVQQGNLGLLKAAAKFEPERECRLVTYAAYWIRAEIRDYVVRNYRIVRLGKTRSERKAVRAFRQKEFVNAEELAEDSGMPLGRARQLFPLLRSSDATIHAPPDGKPGPADKLSSGVQSPEDEVSKAEIQTQLEKELETSLEELSDRERFIVRSRLMSEEPRTLESLGQDLGVSKERVRQLETRARRKLRESLRAFAQYAA